MERHHQVLVTLRQIIRAIDLRSKKLERESGLTGPQLLIMQAIGEAQTISPGTLAKSVSLSQATVTTILDRLEKRYLVLRMRSSDDKRKVAVSLTQEGEELLRQAPNLMQEDFIKAFEELKEWEQTQILSSLQRVAAMMNAEGLDAAPLIDSTRETIVSEPVPLAGVEDNSKQTG